MGNEARLRDFASALSNTSNSGFLTRFESRTRSTLTTMALVRALLWFFYIFVLALSIATLVLSAITESDDDRIDNTTTWFGIVGGIVGLFISLMGLVILATKNLHRRPITTLQQWLNAFAVWWFAIVAGMWILYHNVARTALHGYEHAAFALAFSNSLFWTVIVALWHWKAQEEFALAHK